MTLSESWTASQGARTCVPFQGALTVHLPLTPLPVVLGGAPLVAARPIAPAFYPQALIHVSIGILLLPQAMLQVLGPAALQTADPLHVSSK